MYLAHNIMAAAFQLDHINAFKREADDIAIGATVYIIDDYNIAEVVDIDEEGVHVISINNDIRWQNDVMVTVHKVCGYTYQPSDVRLAPNWPHFE